MADIHDRATRSFNMSQIKGKNTTPEILVRKFLFSKGFRYRIHDKKLPGKPDIVLPKYKTVIFVNGCFWHGHEGCKYFTIPKTRTAWWQNKIMGNQARDKANVDVLENDNWQVLVLWSCDLKPVKINATLDQLESLIRNQ